MTLEFEVAGIAGPLCKVTADSAGTVSDLKDLIAAQVNLDPNCFKLFHGKRELHDRKCLEELRSNGACVEPPEQQEGTADIAMEEGTDEVVALTLLRPMLSEEQVSWLKDVSAARVPFSWLQSAPAGARSDRHVLLAAVARSGRALQCASAELKGDREVVLAAVGQHGAALCFASYGLQGDREVVLAAVTQSWQALEFASVDLRGDREVVSAAVARSGYALQHASDPLKGDRDIVLSAVKRQGAALRYASKDLQKDLEVIMASRRGG